MGRICAKTSASLHHVQKARLNLIFQKRKQITKNKPPRENASVTQQNMANSIVQIFQQFTIEVLYLSSSFISSYPSFVMVVALMYEANQVAMLTRNVK